jgi:hypothetical protein
MAKYKIDSTYLQNPIYLETDSNDEAFEIFVAYCDYNQIDEDDIECEYDSIGICKAVASQDVDMADEYDDDEDHTESISRFTFEKIED